MPFDFLDRQPPTIGRGQAAMGPALHAAGENETACRGAKAGQAVPCNLSPVTSQRLRASAPR